jgi:hypothetical protein
MTGSMSRKIQKMKISLECSKAEKKKSEVIYRSVTFFRLEKPSTLYPSPHIGSVIQVTFGGIVSLTLVIDYGAL